mgnify:CR=1 FL=1
MTRETVSCLAWACSLAALEDLCSFLALSPAPASPLPPPLPLLAPAALLLPDPFADVLCSWWPFLLSAPSLLAVWAVLGSVVPLPLPLPSSFFAALLSFS